MKLNGISENMQIDLSMEELVWVIGGLQDRLELQRGSLEFYSNESNKEFFKNEGINVTEKIKYYKAKVDKLQKMLQEIGGN